ncbi:MAG TPA: AI-2E family transporter [Candidatus Paceibacterota bacterium]
MNEPQRIIVTPSLSGIIKVAVVALCIVALFLVRNVILIMLTSLVIASAIEPGVKGLTKKGLPRVVSVLLIYLLFALIFFIFTLIFIPPMLSEVSNLSVVLPGYLESVNVSDVIPDIIPGGDLVGGELVDTFSIRSGIEQLQSALAGLSKGFLHTASTIFGGALSAMLVLVISFYLAVEERGIETFLRVVTPIQKENYAINLWKRTQEKIGLWLQGQLLLAVIVGVLVYLGLFILQVPYATSLAALAALLEIIPIFGPIIAAIPAIIIAFSISPTLGLMVVGLYVIIQQFENHLIYPLVVTKIVGIPPIIVIVALLAGGQLAGILGFLLAIPLTTVLVELFNDLEKHKLAAQKT